MPPSDAPGPRVFVSYAFHDESFVEMVVRCLRTQGPPLETFFYGFDRRAGTWTSQIEEILQGCTHVVAFGGRRLGDTQREELDVALELRRRGIWVALPAGASHEAHEFGRNLDPVSVAGLEERDALECARRIAQLLGVGWIDIDDIPPGYPFEYEKKIIEAYRKAKEGRGTDEGIQPVKGFPARAHLEHVPIKWPEVFRRAEPDSRELRENPVPKETFGAYRDEKDRILVDSRSRSGGSPGSPEQISLPEAGPREKILLPAEGAQKLRIGIVVSGGIAPGINAVISGIFHRHQLYAREAQNRVEVFGYLEGFKGLVPGALSARYVVLDETQVNMNAHTGGSYLSTSRYNGLETDEPERRHKELSQIVNTLATDSIDVLYVIGGDGSMRAAHAISTVVQRTGRAISVVGIPKTMDNDILWVWQSFGFLSAVGKAREAILHLQTEIHANPRVCIVQLFGSDSGFVVAHAVLGTGQCDYALVPEVPFEMSALCAHMATRLRERRRNNQSPCGMIVMAETAIPRDVDRYIDDPLIGLSKIEKDALRDFMGQGTQPRPQALNWRVRGQTPDALRTAGVKVVAGALTKYIHEDMGAHELYWRDFRVLTNEPRHILRSTAPSVQDVIFGQRLGALAVDNALAGYSDFMISQWNTEYVLVPLSLVVLGRKRLPPDGIFWRSVLASTGQPGPPHRRLYAHELPAAENTTP